MMFWRRYNFTMLRNNRVKSYMWLTLAAYVLMYGAFLYLTNFLPYVLDNNETYSSLVHAYNMYFGDWKTHFGIADEAYSPDPAAHPILHTHQGNWPRIFAYILFALGFRGAESQILIHVYTVGLIAIWLMYRFLAKAKGGSFALICCLAFMTDYMLFAQWQVVTYRVWHVFFVFLSLNCVQEFDSGKRIWKLLFIANFAALYYGELVFAFFVSVWSLFYYAYLVSGNIKSVFKLGLIIAFSGLASILILFAQLSLYMGIKNVFLDFSYTFVARNFYGDVASLREKMQQFYDKLDVVFWYNIVDCNQYKGLFEIIRSIFMYGFQIHTPIIALQELMILVSVVFLSLQENLLRLIPNLINKKISSFLAKVVTFICLCILTHLLFSSNKFLGLYPQQLFYATHAPLIVNFLVLFISLLLCNIFFSIIDPSNIGVKLVNLLSFNIFFIACSYLIWILPMFYEQYLSIIWFKYLSNDITEFAWRLVTLIVAINCALNIALNRVFNLKAIFAFLASAFGAYIIIFILSPGYVVSGYLSRFAPFIVFFLDVILAITMWCVIDGMIFHAKMYKAFLGDWRCFSIHFNSGAYRVSWFKIILAMCFVVMLSMVLFQWFYVQYRYYTLFPANSLAFIKKLRSSEFQGKSLITNQYPLPFSYETRNWGYNGTNFGAGHLEFNENGFSMPHEIEYLWYKNRNQELAYKKPQYYVCFAPTTVDQVLQELSSFTTRARRCSSNRVVSQAILAPNFSDDDLRLRHKLLAADESRLDSWAIVKMDWEYPPFFEKNAITKRHFNVTYNKVNNELKIHYKFNQQDGISESLSKFKITQVHAGRKPSVELAQTNAIGGVAIVKLKTHPNSKIEIRGTPYIDSKPGLVVTEILDIALL